MELMRYNSVGGQKKQQQKETKKIIYPPHNSLTIQAVVQIDTEI